RGGYEIPSDGDQIGVQFIHHFDRQSDGMYGKDRVVVQVAEQRDREAVHAGRPAPQPKFLAHQPRAHGLDQESIDGKRSCSSGHRHPEKSSSVELRRAQTCFRPRGPRRPLLPAYRSEALSEAAWELETEGRLEINPADRSSG